MCCARSVVVSVCKLILVVYLSDALVSYPLQSFESMCMQLLKFLCLSFMFLFVFPISSLVLAKIVYLGSPARLLLGFSSFPGHNSDLVGCIPVLSDNWDFFVLAYYCYLRQLDFCVSYKEVLKSFYSEEWSLPVT